MSVALDRRPGARPVAATTEPADIARFAGWCFAAFIIFTAIYYHSRTADPGVRFAIRNGTITDYGPSWWDQQKFGQFTPGDLAVRRIGHFGPFRQEHVDKMWPRMAGWLQALAAPSHTPA